jgi:hypothetical protein
MDGAAEDRAARSSSGATTLHEATTVVAVGGVSERSAEPTVDDGDRRSREGWDFRSAATIVMPLGVFGSELYGVTT